MLRKLIVLSLLSGLSVVGIGCGDEATVCDTKMDGLTADDAAAACDPPTTYLWTSDRCDDIDTACIDACIAAVPDACDTSIVTCINDCNAAFGG